MDATTTASQCYSNLVNITTTLIQLIESDQPRYAVNTKDAQQQVKRQAHTENQQAPRTEEMALKEEFPENLRKSMTFSSEKGVPSCLTTLPLRIGFQPDERNILRRHTP